ncbi:CDP-glycerol glycerophosphotransferase family protein [Vibrio sp. 10N.286.51.B11]|uniref:CDP-glycerol glycerophosphotransferase family protein n=1 Tax=unclassified Vibrio TaxID=2614977 RepID=UPI0010BD5098|nr:CDP-glycerol glycerophosphotransferase family protein [Vibrio sp. F13]TKG00551.1 hypothetical protein FCV76_14130 [Vibrio sp. F13]
MQLNKYKFIVNRFLNIILGLLPGLIYALFNIRDDRIYIFSSEFNTEFNHNSKSLFLYFLKERKDIQCRFVINDENKRKALISEYGDFFISSHSITGILYILRAKVWITSSLETPIGGVFLNRNRIVIHLGHGAPLKNVGLSESKTGLLKYFYYKIIKTNFSYFFSTSRHFNKNWKECLGVDWDQVVIAAQARNDLITTNDLVNCNHLLDIRKTNILYAPTWRPYSKTILFPFSDFELEKFNDFLIKNEILVYLRLHPNFEGDELDLLQSASNIRLLDRSNVDDINTVLSGFDLLITDYSSIYVDYLLTKKPILFLPYDYREYNEKVGFSIDYFNYTPGPKPESFNVFLQELTHLINIDSYYYEQREFVNNILNAVQSEHCKNNAILISGLCNKAL